MRRFVLSLAGLALAALFIYIMLAGGTGRIAGP